MTELLVVFLILIGLAAITIPFVLNMRKFAGSAKTVTNLRQIQAANMSYASDNGGFFVGNAPFGEGSDKWGAHTWFSYMPFVGMLGVNTTGGGDDGNNIADAWDVNYPEGLKCGLDVPSPGSKQRFTIVMNWSKWTHRQDGTPFSSSDANGHWIDGKILQNRIKNPDKLIMFFESADFWGTFYTRLEWKADDGNWQKGMAFRNKGDGCNVAFADGHVGVLTRKDVEKDNAVTRRYFFWDAN